MYKIIALLSFAVMGTGAQSAEAKAPIKLPEDPSIPVVTLDSRGGRMSPRKSEEPSLTIRADGSVTLGDPFGVGQKVEGTISARELEELLSFAIDDKDFFALDYVEIDNLVKAEQRKANSATKLIDAATTVIRIRTADREHSISFYALRFHAQRYPGIKQLGQLLAIKKRLQRLSNEIRLGGKKGLTKTLQIANDHLQRQYTKAPLLSANDLQYVQPREQGRTHIFFYRQAGLSGEFVSVRIENPNKGKPIIRVQAKLD